MLKQMKKLKYSTVIIYVVLAVIVIANLLIWHNGASYYYARLINGSELSRSIYLTHGYYIEYKRGQQFAISTKKGSTSYIVNLEPKVNLEKAVKKNIYQLLEQKTDCSLYKVNYEGDGLLVVIDSLEIRIHIDKNIGKTDWENLCDAFYLDI